MVLRRKLQEEAKRAAVAKTLKVLCVCASLDTEIKLKSIKDRLDNKFYKITVTGEDEFKTGNIVTKYDVAIFMLLEDEEKGYRNDLMELEEKRPMIEYYLDAPITALFTTRAEAPIPYDDRKSFKHLYFTRQSWISFNLVLELREAFEKLKWAFEDHCRTSVKKIFDTFDLTDDGEVDCDELFKCGNTIGDDLEIIMKELGKPLSREKITRAIDDLDMDGNGSISFPELRRWYFSGMKPYTSNKRALMKMRG